MYVCMYICTYVCICMNVPMYVCTYVRSYVCVYVCQYVGPYVCMYAHTWSGPITRSPYHGCDSTHKRSVSSGPQALSEHADSSIHRTPKWRAVVKWTFPLQINPRRMHRCCSEMWQTLMVRIAFSARAISGWFLLFLTYTSFGCSLKHYAVKKRWFRRESETAQTLICVHAGSCVQHVSFDIHWPRLISLEE
jgi:hypothetical protein